ncbi:hypothetical protein F4679DRAFT_595048 [Xylaria curta]|nr:hypothetical protein F4679DRAFT_595048 [Xylaria curta]
MAPDISITDWYAIGGGAVLAIPLLFQVHQAYGSMLRLWLNRHLVYPLLVYDVTRLQALLLVVYVSANGLVLTLFPDHGPSLEQRAALLSTLNIVTVFLGGRTNPLIDMANVSLRTYYFWHFWAGRVILIEGLLHAGIRIAQHASRTDSLAVSGWIVSVLFLLLLVGSLPLFRRWSYAIFIKVHFVLTLGTLVGLIWHVLTRSLFSKAPVFIAATFWIGSTVYRILLRWKWRHGKLEWDGDNVHMLKLTLGKAVRPYPGMYFYFYFSGQPIRYKFSGVRMNPFFWALDKGEDSTCKLHFSVQAQDHLQIGDQIPAFSIEGPYGKNLRAERYETVILIAEGAGITGVLPYAIHIAYRREHDRELKKDNAPLHSSDKYRDVTRKIDLIWKLNSTEEELLCKDQMEALMRMDSKMTLLSGLLLYPSEGPKKIRFPGENEGNNKKEAGKRQENKPWSYKLAVSGWLVEAHIHHHIKWHSYSAGKSLAIVCGSRSFCRRAREYIVTTPRLDVDFAESELIPGAEIAATTHPLKVDDAAGAASISAAKNIKAPSKISKAVGNRQRDFRETEPSSKETIRKRHDKLAAREIRVIRHDNWV